MVIYLNAQICSRNCLQIELALLQWVISPEGHLEWNYLNILFPEASNLEARSCRVLFICFFFPEITWGEVLNGTIEWWITWKILISAVLRSSSNLVSFESIVLLLLLLDLLVCSNPYSEWGLFVYLEVKSLAQFYMMSSYWSF